VVPPQEGYLAAGGQLDAGERELLPALAGARVALSVTMGAAAAEAAPSNAAYVMQTQRPGWRLLALLDARGEGAVAAALLPAAASAAVAAAAAVPARA
jgi:hypothetical protein